MKIAYIFLKCKHSIGSDNSSPIVYYVNRDVHLFPQNDTLQILDLQRGQFYGLDTIASQMLSLTLEKGFEATITEITNVYNAPEEQIRRDLTELLESLLQKKLLVTSPPTKDDSHPSIFHRILIAILKQLSLIVRKILNPEPAPNTVSIKLLLSLAWISFRFLGWGRTIALWQNFHVSAKAEPSLESLEKIDRMVRQTASGKLFLPVVCKERALVGYHLLRTFYGFPATLVIGVNNYPFQVHAWVDCDGLTLTDDREHIEQFTSVNHYS